MKKAILAVLLVVLAVCVGWQTLRASRTRIDPRIAKFNEDAENLLFALQQYKEFAGAYPTGNNLDIARALSGHGDKKIVILAVRKSDLNQKGEIVDPWGTPLQFYFTANSVLIRSAGPNKVFEDSSAPNCDDLFRSN
ncbi:MAG: hypothetical protein NZ739_05580 [Verrucomicrobiae bacterium]|nr:hypothetical protein [Verrucomicrobiae bacterium]MDW7980750.1 hypothetical protein [Verrucomicrobiales bacterium]